MLTSDPMNTPQTLQLSSESQTGIKIPSGQIAGGSFVVAAGDKKDLNLDFDACASIVTQGNGMYRLKPVLHAGEVTLQATSTSISGTVIDAGTMQAVAGGTTVVAIEQKDSTGIDRVVMETVADSNGGFSFCPLPAGMYDVVISAVNGSGNVYAATSADLSLSALQSITVNNSSVLVTVPLAAQSMATATTSTAAGAGCPANTDCVTYTLAVPAANPSVGAFMGSANQSPAAPAMGLVNYTIDAIAFVPGAAAQLDCNPSDLQTSQTTTNTALTVTAGTPANAATLGFTGCQ